MRLVVAILALCALAGCRAPTEVVVELKTDVVCSDLQGVEIRVGPVQGLDERPASASTDACSSSGRIGSVVLVPSGGKSDEVAVQVVAGFGRPVEECQPPGYGPGCIVARRAVRYVPHTPLHLSIALRADCNGVACDETTTCRNGECVDAHVSDPSSCTSGCGDNNLQPTGPHITANCGDMRGLQAGAAWPMPGYCPTRGGHSPFSGPSGTKTVWPLDTTYWGTPLIAADGTVLIGSSDGNVYALRGDTGKLRWQHQVGSGQVFVELLGAGGSVDYGMGGDFGALDVNTGKPLWLAKNVYSQQCAPVVDGEQRIILVGTDGNVYAIDGRDGSKLWQYTPQAPAAGASIGTDGTVFLAESGFLVALDPTTGKLRWRKALPDTSKPSMPVITDQGLVVVAGPKGTRAFDATTGETKWNATDGSDSVAVGADGTLYLPQQSNVRALDPDSGNELWHTAFDVGTTPIVDADGMLFVAGVSGDVARLDPRSHKLVWTAQPGGGGLQFGGGITADHRYVVGSVLGGIYAVGP